MNYILAHLFYYAGHIVSKPMHYFDWGWLYPIYNWLMIKSSEYDIYEWIWNNVDEHEEEFYEESHESI